MGEIQNQPVQLCFNASQDRFPRFPHHLRRRLVLVREVDERLSFGELIEQHLTDSCRGKNTRFPFADLLRQLV